MTIDQPIELHLIPYPQHVHIESGQFVLAHSTAVRLISGKDGENLSAAQLLIRTIEKKLAFVPALRGPGEENHTGSDIEFHEENLAFSSSPEAYRLVIKPQKIIISASHARGRF